MSAAEQHLRKPCERRWRARRSKPARTTRYRHVVSLGFFCSTALELARYGFRDASYPFDWVICPIVPTIRLLTSGFSELLNPDSLQRDDARADIVHDHGAGIDLYHDFSPELTIEEQLNAVRDKYTRRADRFQHAATERTLFVRYIQDQEEFNYLEDHLEELLSTLRRFHPLNGLLLVGSQELPRVCGELRVYGVVADKDDVVAREFLRKNRRLRLRLLTLHYPLSTRIRNYARYRQSRLRRHAWASSKASLIRRFVVALLGEERSRGLLVRLRATRAKR